MSEPAFWFIFGEHPDGIHVDVSDGERDVMVRVDRAEAENAIAKHNCGNCNGRGYHENAGWVRNTCQVCR